MSQSIVNYVNVSVSLEGTGPQPAGFGVPMFVHLHSVTSNRLDGPFTSVASLVAAGFTAAAAAPVYNWATAVFAQQPRVTQVYIGRRTAGDANLAAALDAIYAVNPGAWYCVNIENRDATNIKELAAWCEAVPKIAVAQCNDPSLVSGAGPEYTLTVGGTATDGNYSTIFTGFGLGSPVTITTARSGGSPATNAALATQHAADITTAIGTTLAGVVASATADGGDVVVVMENDLAAGTVTHAAPSPGTLSSVNSDDDVGSDLFNANYTRTALVYHPTDADYVDGAWSSRCLSFNLDQKKGIWAFKRLNGITGTSLTDAQITALRNTNTNYFAPAVSSAGVAISAFTAQGWLPSGDAGAGRRIDVTISLDWLKARMEEAILDVLLRETHGVPYTDAGIGRFATAVKRVLDLGVAAGHLVEFIVPEGEDNAGLATPVVITPKLADTTAAIRTSRTLTFSAVCYLRSAIEKVVFSVEVKQ